MVAHPSRVVSAAMTGRSSPVAHHGPGRGGEGVNQPAVAALTHPRHGRARPDLVGVGVGELLEHLGQRDAVGDMMSVPIDRTKPLWHMYLIDGYGQGCALLIRVSHAVADGIALAQVFQQLTA